MTQRSRLCAVIACFFTIMGGSPAVLAEVDVTVLVLDKQQKPVPGVFVMATASSVGSAQYVMDQVNMAFKPRVLVVPVGAEVSFPNSDPIAHHVYSISKPNNFTLPLYHGKLPNPVRFDHENVVVLGCNIHDHMVGHIVVSSRELQGQTGLDGAITFSVSESEMQANPTVQIWSPRIRAREQTTRTIRTIGSRGDVTFQLERRLRTPVRRAPLSDY